MQRVCSLTSRPLAGCFFTTCSGSVRSPQDPSLAVCSRHAGGLFAHLKTPCWLFIHDIQRVCSLHTTTLCWLFIHDMQQARSLTRQAAGLGRSLHDPFLAMTAGLFADPGTPNRCPFAHAMHAVGLFTHTKTPCCLFAHNSQRVCFARL